MGKDLAFFEGKIVPVSSAKVGIMTHALHYGTAVFEGIRVYNSKALFIKSYKGASALFIGSVIDFSTPSMMLFWFRC